eukprot:6190368-Pleurochrysis_carterae.AAC.5
MTSTLQQTSHCTSVQFGSAPDVEFPLTAAETLSTDLPCSGGLKAPASDDVNKTLNKNDYKAMITQQHGAQTGRYMNHPRYQVLWLCNAVPLATVKACSRHAS